MKKYTLLTFSLSSLFIQSGFAGNPCGTACVIASIARENPTIGTLQSGGFVAGTRASGCPATLIAQTTNESNNAVWAKASDGAFITSVAEAVSPTDGRINTKAIIDAGISEGAALLCSQSSVGGYTDWYLPSIGELQCIINHKFSLPNFDKNAAKTYWTSNQSILATNSARGLGNNDNDDFDTHTKNTNSYAAMCIRRA